MLGQASTGRILKTEGGKIDYSGASLVTTQVSPSLADIVKITNKESNNLFAEHLFKMMGVFVKNNGNVDSGVAAVSEYFISQHVLDTPLHLYDGCGIARRNLVTANQLVQVLSYMLDRKSVV